MEHFKRVADSASSSKCPFQASANLVIIGPPGSGKSTLASAILGCRVGVSDIPVPVAICFKRTEKASLVPSYHFSEVRIDSEGLFKEEKPLSTVGNLSDIQQALRDLLCAPFREVVPGPLSSGATALCLLQPSRLASDLTFTGFNFLQIEGNFERIPYGARIFDLPGVDKRTPFATIQNLNTFIQRHATTTAFVYDSEIWQFTERDAFAPLMETLLAVDGKNQKLVLVNSKLSLYGLYSECGYKVVLDYLKYVINQRLNNLKRVKEISKLLESKTASFLAVDALALLMDVSGGLNEALKARVGLLRPFLDENMRGSFETEFAIETSSQSILPSEDSSHSEVDKLLIDPTRKLSQHRSASSLPPAGGTHHGSNGRASTLTVSLKNLPSERGDQISSPRDRRDPKKVRQRSSAPSNFGSSSPPLKAH